MDLGQIRVEIDRIDRAFVQLFEERMAICEDVARAKIEMGKEVFDGQREKEKITSIKELTETERYKEGAAVVLQSIMDESKKLQVILIDEYNNK